MNSRTQQLEAFGRLLEIMDELRDKCPWDRKQTLLSLRCRTIEEIYELADAILENNLEEVKNELGDVLLHLVFYAKIGSEKKAFDIGDVANAISDKLINRHPHVYGALVVKSEQEVRKNWQKSKLNEGKKSVLEGVPKNLPAVVKASSIQDKVSALGFYWKEPMKAWQKVQEELHELDQEIKNGNADSIESEYGDVLFSLVNYARFVGVNPENALERTNKKFIKRFQHIEQVARKQGKELSEMSLKEMEVLWVQSKKIFK